MNLREKALTIGLFLISIISYSQSNKINEFKSKLHECIKDSCIALNSYQLARHYLNINLDSTLYYANLTTQKSKLINNNKIEFSGLLIVALAYQKKREFEKSDSINTILKRKVGKVENNLKTAFFSSLGNYYYRRMEYDSAIVYYNKIIDNLKIEDNDYYKSLIATKLNISNIYKHTHQYNKAINILLEVEKLLENPNTIDSLNLIETKASLALKKGLIYKDMKDFKSAEIQYLKAIELSSSLTEIRFKVYTNLGNLYQKQNKRNSLKTVLDTLGNNFKNLSLSSKRAYLDLKVDFLFNEGKYNEALGANEEYKSFLLSNKYSKLYFLFYNNLGLIYKKQGKISKAHASFKSSLELMAKTKEDKRSQYASALFNYIVTYPKLDKEIVEKIYHYENLRDTIENMIVSEEVFQAKEKYETEKKELQNQKLIQEQKIDKEKIKIQQLYLLLTLSGLLILALLSYLFYKRAKQRKQLNEELKEKNEELKSYNTELIKTIDQMPEENLLQQHLTLSDRQKTSIKLKNILYIESKNKAVFIHTTDGKTYKDWQSLKSYLDILPKSLFLQTNRATIINKTHILSKQNGTITLKGGQVITNSRAYLKE